MAGTSGTVFLTADSDVTAGGAVRVFAVHEVYGAAPTGSVLRNGTDASGDAFIQLNATASTGITTEFGPNGFRFPNGLFFDEGTNVTSILIEFATEFQKGVQYAKL